MQALTFVHLCMLKLEDALEISQSCKKRIEIRVHCECHEASIHNIYIS